MGLGSILMLGSFFACGEGKPSDALVQAQTLNQLAYEKRYQDLEVSEKLTLEALQLGGRESSLKAEALNNLAFCSFIHMDFERADSLFQEVYDETANEIECLVADVGMMKICQRTAMNKEFYDYRNSALRRMKRIGEEEGALENETLRKRYNYARSEFFITSAIYYYYLQQEEQAWEAINAIQVEQELSNDTAQFLNYHYMKGSGGLYKATNPEDIVIGEFDHLMECLMLSHAEKYIYFEANASQAMAELLLNPKNYDLLLQKRPGMMRIANHSDLAWEDLVIAFAQNALKLFEEYGDWYQISSTHRTLASCYNAFGKHEEALHQLTEALSYVNLHHEKYYHCPDTLDRLKPYVPLATASTELKWINTEGIKTVPEWIARLREQLSVTYAALGMKPESDYNRNIYLDILDYTRQDKEMESRYMALKEETIMLNGLLALVLIGFLLMLVLLYFLNKNWHIRNASYVKKLKTTLEICQSITGSVPSDAEDMDDVLQAMMKVLKEKALPLVGATDMEIHLWELNEEMPKWSEGMLLLKNSKGQPLGVWKMETPSALTKEDRMLLEVIAPYLSWTLENGLAMISLGDEKRRLEQEQYVHKRHLIENKRQNVIKKACLFVVTGITPYIDRVVNEVHKLISLDYLANKEIKESKYTYINELIHRINEYNDILALWIKMRRGTVSLNIENFELNTLFELIQKGRRNFEVKEQTFSVKPTDAFVKADKALTLFMINTLTENARKYTPSGGEIKVYATETEDYVEISVCDNGPGLSKEDMDCILSEKVYDSGKIGLHTSHNVEELRKNKGSGFGLMNCRGIIEKYRKTNELFRVCLFHVESQLDKGSRFYFRLPKGIRRTLGICLLIFPSVLFGCDSKKSPIEIDEMETMSLSSIMDDSLVYEANRLANRVYHANLDGNYQEAIAYADSAFACLNAHFLKYAEQEAPLLKLVSDETPTEVEWYNTHFDTDYYALLDIRNEAAIAYLAMGELDEYRYNNRAYTALYKQISVDDSLEEYCQRMRMSANNKIVAIVLCVILVLCLWIGYYWLYLRHRLKHRYGLEQVLEINRRALNAPAYQQEDLQGFVTGIVNSLHQELNGLVTLDCWGIAVSDEVSHDLCFAFSELNEEEETMKQAMYHSFKTKSATWMAGEGIRCLPLSVEVGKESRCVGVMALRFSSRTEQEDNRLMLELVAGYVSILIYNAVELIAQKYRDIEWAQDENRRVIHEENQLHVQNMVLDNCLSTIKHETIYYPNRIRQILEHLHEQTPQEEVRQIEAIVELIGYYKDVFTLLSSCASRQLEEVTFRRTRVQAADLAKSVDKYFQRITRKLPYHLELKVNALPLTMTGDIVLLQFMLENLINEALTYQTEGVLELKIYQEGRFVRFDFIDRRRSLEQEELNQLFYPHLSRMKQGRGEVLTGTEYLICKQIIRDHDEFAGRRGCRINACKSPNGGFMVWFTIPSI